MQIKMIPHDFVINGPMQFRPGMIQSDFVLKAVNLKNDTTDTITITKIAFELNVQGSKIKEISYDKTAAAKLLAEFPDKIQHCSGWDLKVMLGQEKFWNTSLLAGGAVLEPGEETGLLNEFYIVIYQTLIDELILTVEYIRNGENLTEKRSLPVIPYKTRNQYTFPVKGVWQVNGNYDCLGAHRTQYSMEFALDLGKVDTETVYHKDEDYSWYGEEILAIADGEVVSCFNDTRLRLNFPEDSETDEQILEERKQMVEEYGHMPLQCGNHVVLKHKNGEYSLYGHMIYHSLTVKKGDFVKQGQVIGKIGNTGKSACPHLHFQLMNGPDYSAARGLPCHFTNIMDAQRNKLDLIHEEYTIIAAK